VRDATTLRAVRRLRAIRGEARSQLDTAAVSLDAAPDDNGDGWRAARVIRAIRARAAAAVLDAAREEVQHA
jgi:hypothetical protein